MFGLSPNKGPFVPPLIRLPAPSPRSRRGEDRCHRRIRHSVNADETQTGGVCRPAFAGRDVWQDSKGRAKVNIVTLNTPGL